MLNPPVLPFLSNRLLAALPANEYQRILPSLEAVSLEIKDGLHQPYTIIEHVYFPLSGMVSILVVMGNGKLAEAAIVGNEGVVGLAVFLGSDTTITDAFYQVTGEAVRMPVDPFREEINRNGTLTRLLQRYAQAYFAMLAQNSGCHSHHTVNKRCARWLLQTHDRVGENKFQLTHEFLGQMLGVRRASVSTAMLSLSKAGFIHYHRGILTIVDRAGLEGSACECYRIIADEYKRLLG